MKRLFGLSSVFLLIASLFTSMIGCAEKKPVTLNVSAAATLTDVLKEINSLYIQEKPNINITTNFASSGTIQIQIENGAAIDIFMSGAALQMDNLQNKQLLLNDTRKDLLSNKIVLIVPNDSKLDIASFVDSSNEKVKKIAIGDPKSVTSGMYTQQALEQIGIWEKIQPKLVLASDVRQALIYVESGNVDAGFVYLTDALTSNKVKVVANAPDEINANIVYPVAVIKNSQNSEAAKDYVNFLFTKQVKTILEKYGFSIAIK